MNTSLNAARRTADLEALVAGEVVDVLVVGGGVTGTGVALDAASRGLRVALLERHDLAFGTSRWSSKLVHGGLRYLASGDVALARQSAVERGILMARTAPHLVRPLPMLVPFMPGVSRLGAVAIAAGFAAGDLIRRTARTGPTGMSGPRALSRDAAMALVPGLRSNGLRGGLLTADGQLTDDARLVVSLARTAAGYGARILTRVSVHAVEPDRVRVTDEVTGTRLTIRTRSVVNATGVWAGDLAPHVRLRPSRGTHLILGVDALGTSGTGLTVPVPGERRRFTVILPTDDNRVYVGLTDEPVNGPKPEVPCPDSSEVQTLLELAGSVLDRRPGPEDVLGAFAGLRPLVAGRTERTADLSRRHVIVPGPDRVVTVVGGKLTTYRAMAEDAVNAVVGAAGLVARPCRTRNLPLVGAAGPSELARLPAPGRLVRRYGTEAPAVQALALDTPDLAAPLADGVDVTGAEVLFARDHEGALTDDDVLDRRTRIGLVGRDREKARPAVTRLFSTDP